MTKVELNRVVPISIPGTPGDRPGIGLPCETCPALFNHILYDRKDHPDAAAFHYRCNPLRGEGRSEMTTTIVYSENGSDVRKTTEVCGVA